MDYAGGPDDNTSVVKMVKSLYTFLGKFLFHRISDQGDLSQYCNLTIK